ncbi:hypothetical protein ACFYO0_12845 [Streptomyces sp. NPDC006365]|uniref:hypothetical protein n=1 Tax=Streptomyces sp. NPDC006365 TaxID=3364744 RepID=UPI003693AFC2
MASLVVSTSGSEEQYRAAYNQAIPQIVSEAQAAGKHGAYVDTSSLTTADLADTLHPNDTATRTWQTPSTAASRPRTAPGG